MSQNRAKDASVGVCPCDLEIFRGSSDIEARDGAWRCVSNPNLLHLAGRDVVGAAVVELGGARRGVGRYLLRVFEQPVVLQIGGDAGREERVVTDARLDARLLLPAAVSCGRRPAAIAGCG